MKQLTDTMQIGGLEIRGRIVMPPMATYQCTEEGLVTDPVVDYYRKRAENPHVGLIITEHSYICPQGRAKVRQMSAAGDDCIPGMRRLTDAVHQGGARVFAQLNHGGSASPREVTGMQAVAPSALALPVTPAMGDPEPAEATLAQMQEIAEDFARAAVWTMQAGYDGAEIHAAHGYLLNQFYSPLTNHRSDAYGGTLENRLRLLREVIRAVRKAVGPGYPLSVRLGGCDYAKGGNTIRDAAEAAKILCGEDIQLLSISGGMNRYTLPGHTEPGYFAEMSRAVKQAASVPVMVAGGVRTLADAQRLVEEGAADLIGVGRMLMKDPDWEK